MRLDDYERIIVVWENAVAASERHLKIAAQLQRDGLEAMREAKQSRDEGAERNAMAILETGVSIERTAYGELLTLHRSKPRQAPR